MRRGGTISFSFPPFAGWVKRIILACTGIFLLQLILENAFHVNLHPFPGQAGFPIDEWFALIPVFVMKGKVWQLVTYSLLHASFGHLFFNMLTLWFIGSYLERDFGPRRFIECYLFCVVGAALVTIAVSYTHFLGMNPQKGTVGASGGIFGLLMAFGVLYADQEMYLFPLPFRIKAKYLVGVWILVAVVGALSPAQERRGQLRSPRRTAVWVFVCEVSATARAHLCGFGAVFRGAELVLPMEAAAGGKEI